MYYILSLKWSSGHILTWWQPDRNGYTFSLDEAGRYTAAEVEADRKYYDDGVETKAVPCEVVEGLTMRVVSDRHRAKFVGNLT
jgi:hypothetical protein